MMPKLHVETYGKGDITLVMCNGLSQSTANWRSMARQNPQFRWILFDPRGHGRSDIGPRPYTIDDHVADLLSVMQKTTHMKPVLLGFSHGGRVAIRAAARFPQRFMGLILISTGAKATPLRKAHVQSWRRCLELGGVEAMAWASLPNIIGTKILEKFPDLGVLVKGSAARNRAEGLSAMFEGMENYPPVEGDARRIKMPTLLCYGQQDPLVGDADLADMASWIPHGKTAIFPDCGHTLPLESPQQFIDEIGVFIQQQVLAITH